MEVSGTRDVTALDDDLKHASTAKSTPTPMLFLLLLALPLALPLALLMLPSLRPIANFLSSRIADSYTYLTCVIRAPVAWLTFVQGRGGRARREIRRPASLAAVRGVPRHQDEPDYYRPR